MSLVDIGSLPKSAIQAIYHAVTGKTERYSKTLKGSVSIKFEDLQRLFDRMKQEIEHLDLLADPTVTVLIKTADSKAIRHSSWEHFQHLQENTIDVTSEVILKVEMVLKVKASDTPQRLVITIILDSGLPLLGERENTNDVGFLEFMLSLSPKWNTCKVSVDFVDFVLSQRFVACAERWFAELQGLPTSKLNGFIARRWRAIRDAIQASGYIGMATFLASYTYFRGQDISTSEILFCSSIALALFGVWSASWGNIYIALVNRLTSNIFPTVILLTEGDKRKFKELSEKRNSPRNTLFILGGSILTNLLVNLTSSYLYTLLDHSQ